jgi:hypothetical protein
MGLLDQLKKLFGGPSSDSFDSRMEEFVRQERARPDETAAAAGDKAGAKEKIANALRTVETIAGAFRAYVEDRVLRRFGDQFRVVIPNDAQTRDLDILFGDAKTGNEYRYVKVTFQDRYAVCMRVQAIIISRDVQIRMLFAETRKGGASQTAEVDLSGYSSLADVKWEQVFEKTFIDFLDWQKALAKSA